MEDKKSKVSLKLVQQAKPFIPDHIKQSDIIDQVNMMEQKLQSQLQIKLDSTLDSQNNNVKKQKYVKNQIKTQKNKVLDPERQKQTKQDSPENENQKNQKYQNRKLSSEQPNQQKYQQTSKDHQSIRKISNNEEKTEEIKTPTRIKYVKTTEKNPEQEQQFLFNKSQTSQNNQNQKIKDQKYIKPHKSSEEENKVNLDENKHQDRRIQDAGKQEFKRNNDQRYQKKDPNQTCDLKQSSNKVQDQKFNNQEKIIKNPQQLLSEKPSNTQKYQKYEKAKKNEEITTQVVELKSYEQNQLLPQDQSNDRRQKYVKQKNNNKQSELDLQPQFLIQPAKSQENLTKNTEKYQKYSKYQKNEDISLLIQDNQQKYQVKPQEIKYEKAIEKSQEKPQEQKQEKPQENKYKPSEKKQQKNQEQVQEITKSQNENSSQQKYQKKLNPSKSQHSQESEIQETKRQKQEKQGVIYDKTQIRTEKEEKKEKIHKQIEVEFSKMHINANKIIINEKRKSTKINTGFLNILMVAEKPSIAQTMAESFGNEKYDKRKNYEVKTHFNNIPCKARITSVAGQSFNSRHIYGCDFPPKYKDWNKTDPEELFNAETEKNPCSGQSVISNLQHAAKDMDILMLWLDNDKEGENICFEVLEICFPFMKKQEFRQVYRVKFSSLVKKDILEAYSKTVDLPNFNESLSVDARQIIDLKIGVAFSRFQSNYFSSRYKDLSDKLISFGKELIEGPCQTPTLGFCVRRQQEIESFRPKEFFKIQSTTFHNDKEAIFKLEKVTFDEAEIKLIKKDVDSVGQLEITQVKSTETKTSRPTGLNTVSLLKTASTAFGIGPHHALSIAEKLYLRGYTTYPRTESTSYPKNFDFHGICNYKRPENSLLPKI